MINALIRFSISQKLIVLLLVAIMAAAVATGHEFNGSCSVSLRMRDFSLRFAPVATAPGSDAAGTVGFVTFLQGATLTLECWKLN